MGKAVDQVIGSRASSSAGELSARRRRGRAINAIANYLRSQLRVPNVYINPTATGLSTVDVLAADAAGSGDIHAVRVEMLTKPIGTMSLKIYIDMVKRLPGHYKYLAIPKGITNVSHDSSLFFSPDGIGRVGILLFSESMDILPLVDLAIKPERFRVPSDELAQIERYLNRAKPDMFVRI